jgi:hypothetical protein
MEFMNKWGKSMDKKILAVGSILVIVMISLASLHSVIGSHTLNSSANSSPLFTVRVDRANNDGEDAWSYEYAGKGEETILSSPSRDNDNVGLLKGLEKIVTMNEKEFNRLLQFALPYIEKSRDIDIEEMIDSVRLLKENPDMINKGCIQEKKDTLYTLEGCETVGFIWVPECWLILFWLLLAPFVWLILTLATMIFFCL